MANFEMIEAFLIDASTFFTISMSLLIERGVDFCEWVSSFAPFLFCVFSAPGISAHDILTPSDESEMFGVDAIPFPAQVIHHSVFWYGAFVELIRDAVRYVCNIGIADVSVPSVAVSIRSPLPTPGRKFFEFFIESCFQRFVFSHTRYLNTGR